MVRASALGMREDVLSPRMVRVIEGLASDWHRLDERIEVLSSEIEELAKRDAARAVAFHSRKMV